MLSEVIIKCSDITKIKKFKNATVFYTENSYYVCETTQEMPKQDDIFITLHLKKRGDENAKN